MKFLGYTWDAWVFAIIWVLVVTGAYELVRLVAREIAKGWFF